MAIQADFHLHSDFSNDSWTPMGTMVEAALARGLKEICFTEHTDLGGPRSYYCDMQTYREIVEALNARYAGRICLRAGAEFGLQRGTAEEIQQFYDRFDFDFVILSCHRIDGMSLWDPEFLGESGDKACVRRYFEAVLNAAKAFKHYCVLGHLDLIARYHSKGPAVLQLARDLVEEILRLAIEDGKGIEVNTSSFRYRVSDLTPSREILRLYRQLGGEIITLGSDAHDSNFIADHFETVGDILRDMGYRHYCTFKNMQPVWHRL